MVWPSSFPAFRHEYAFSSDGSPRLAVVRRPDSEWFEVKDETITRVYMAHGKLQERALVRRFELLGRYPPKGPSFEWGWRVSLAGSYSELPSRDACSDAGLGAFFDLHEHQHEKTAMKFLAEFFEWCT